MRQFFAATLSVLLLLFSLALGANEGGGEKEGGGIVGPQYVPLEPVLVNLDGRRHYMRVVIQVLMEDAGSAEKLGSHMPAIRHSLIMLLSGRNLDQVSTVQERESLRVQAREEVRKVLETFHAGKGVKDLFFTDFMVQ
ncbi:flagellar basal body-associated FliL family protein [Methyloterricola oryzae]|uniref:flagellar basal body-associated FliL family protein n=1 Tax=Methyloterricola oryzae TaxID=1495050 RepID=UPI00069C81AE|nr:flagellar basal body-associated FliL family protein [Methyloterricola oryzae]